MGQALYRKYRSKTLDEVVGQEHITTTLKHALEQDRISHAYLFTGPRGVGKTSIARIMAHEINNLPYSDDAAHIDIIEIDAASNRRIDEIRELREKVYVAPAIARYKVYIIDEVHMLTREAFNALLKTLEEPPAHVVFILATTDAHKLPETIISRTQRFTFKPVDQQKVIAHLRTIARQENIAISDEALALLAAHGEGSFRDSISLLDQSGSRSNRLELDDVRLMLGIPPAETIDELINVIASGQPAALMVALSALYEQGFEAASIAKQLSTLLRGEVTEGTPRLGQQATIQLLERLLEVGPAHEPERYLELVLLEQLPDAMLPAPLPSQAAGNPANIEPAPSTSKKAVSKSHKKVVPDNNKKTAPQPSRAAPTPSIPKAAGAVNITVWPQVLAALKQQYNTIYGAVRMAQVDFPDSDTVELRFTFAFHQKRINEAKNQQILATVIEQVTGRKVKITCRVDTKAKATEIAPAATTDANPDISAISNIFGGGEVLES